jgi:Protein of unknown function (DUF1501)
VLVARVGQRHQRLLEQVVDGPALDVVLVGQVGVPPAGADRPSVVASVSLDRRSCCPPLLENLAQRGLLEETLVVCLGEFGRTPRINARAGRDHWGHVYSVALAGGGVRGGQVYGSSDGLGGQPRDGLVRPHDLTATVFHALGHDPATEIHDTLGRPLPISRGEVIRQVF